MSSQGNNENSTSIRDRRGSFTPGSSLSEFLSSNRQPQPTTAYPGPITTAAAHANNQRRMSMSSANGSPPRVQTSYRRGSVSSVSSASSMLDESAIDESEPASGSPSSPFARRMSWGARALRDVRIPVASRVPSSPSASSPTISRGFWLDNKGSNSYPTDPSFQQRRQSMPPPPVNAMPAPKDKSHDHLQERMLRNELYMD
ncbi:hypothetical protein BDD12DRAFT_805136 [Trichophaea hybrida]|nr:hypothetical protein BDD12DRAFT_805136 [Trichophaea hybrida]